MTGTLLKHEWLRTRGALGMFFGVTVLVGLLGSLLGVTGWPVLSLLGLVLGFLAVMVLVPGAQLLLAADYWRSGYGRTGYFTHSIPVRGSTIFAAKLIWAFLASLVGLVFTLALGWVVWWAASVDSGLAAPTFAVIGDVLASVGALVPAWMIIVAVLLLPIWLAGTTVYYYFSVSIGHESRLASLGAGGPIVVFVILYICTQVLTFLSMVLIPFGLGVEGDRLALVSFDVLGEMTLGASGGGDVMPVGFVASLVVLTVLCVWRTARSWNRKVALR